MTEEWFEENRCKPMKEVKTPTKLCYYSNNRKKQQRLLNAFVKSANKMIRDDFLWRSRFFIRQVQASFSYFSDGSGAELFVVLRVYDKKTLTYIDTLGTVSEFCFCDGYRLFLLLNKAITEEFLLDEKGKITEDPYADRIDYMQIPEEYVIKNSKELHPYYNHISNL